MSSDVRECYWRPALWEELEAKTEASGLLKKSRYVAYNGGTHIAKSILSAASTAVNPRLHANYLTLPESGEMFAIAGTVPLTHTDYLRAFWGMGRVIKILDLTTAKDEVNPYYPREGSPIVFSEDARVVFMGIEEGEKEIYEFLESEEVSAHFERMHYSRWPDRGVVSIRELAGLVEKVRSKLFKEGETLFVHCRAGLGRTGTVITALALRKLIEEGVIRRDSYVEKLEGLVLHFRKERAHNFVQTKEQYELLFQYGLSLFRK